jgi:hypothetical protein
MLVRQQLHTFLSLRASNKRWLLTGVRVTPILCWSCPDDLLLANDEHSQPKGTQPELDQQLSTSLPSSELKGAQPHEHVGGVGSLPGTISESSVALLPDERAERDTRRLANLKKDESQARGDSEAKSAYLSGAAVAAKPEVSLV